MMATKKPSIYKLIRRVPPGPGVVIEIGQLFLKPGPYLVDRPQKPVEKYFADLVAEGHLVELPDETIEKLPKKPAGYQSKPAKKAAPKAPPAKPPAKKAAPKAPPAKPPAKKAMPKSK